MKRFILLLNHDDLSLTAYLQHCMERGEYFVKAAGNIFTFSRQGSAGERIAAVTYVNEDPDLKMKFQLEDYSALMKKRGWQTVCVGNPEDIFDSKRHVFLKTDLADAPEPLRDTAQALKASKREVRSLIRCIAMLLLMLGFGIFFLSHDPDVFLSSNHILIPCLTGAAAWACSFIFSINAAITLMRKKNTADGFRNYLIVDRSVLLCMISVGMLLMALVFDLFLYPDTGRTMVRGDRRVTVYQDEVPLSLTDLNIAIRGTFHSSRFTERKGALMRSIHGSDQSFSDPDSAEDLSLISYSVYESGREVFLDWTAGRKGLQGYPLSEELGERWHSDEVHTDGRYRFSVRYPGVLLTISSTVSPEEIDPGTVLERLDLAGRIR